MPEMRGHEEYDSAFGVQRAKWQWKFVGGIIGIGPCEWRVLLRRRLRLSLKYC